MNPQELAEKLAALLASPAGHDAGFRSAEKLDGDPAVGVEVDDDLYFLTVEVA